MGTQNQACNITDRDQLRKHKSRISISRKSRTPFPRLLGHVWAGSLMYITGSYGTMAMLHALMVFHEAKCSGCGASSPLGTLMTRMLAGPRHNALRLYLGRDTSGPARISQNVTGSWQCHMPIVWGTDMSWVQSMAWAQGAWLTNTPNFRSDWAIFPVAQLLPALLATQKTPQNFARRVFLRVL